MDIRFLDSSTQWLLVGIALLAVCAVALSHRLSRRQRGVVTATVIAGLAVVALVGELAIAWMVRNGAPASSDFNEFHWVFLAPWQRVGMVLGVLCALIVVALAWRASARFSSPWRRAALIGLRIGAAGAALVLFLQPAVELRQVAREPNRIAILVDESSSMGLREDKDGPRRFERARALLERSSSTLERWRENHYVDVFAFADTLMPSSLALAATQEPRGPATMIRVALEQVRAHYDEGDLAGVVLISDGVATGGLRRDSGETPGEDFLQSLGTRVHTVWVGRSGLEDVAVSRVLVDEFAFVRTVVRIEAVIQATGYDLRRIPITLSSQGKALRQKWIEIGPGDTNTSVVFELSPPQVGKFVYEISTPVTEGEAVSENNRRSFILRVIRDKTRVLQIAGQPSWDVRALRHMLEQNPNVDLISFFILRTLDDHSVVPNDEMSLIPFPTRELFQHELPSFDVIVMQNFDFAPYGIGVYLENIRRYVEGGGALVMLGGTLSFSSGGYSVTPIAEALPVTLPTRFRSWRELIDTSRFRPVLTDEGKNHPVTALRYEPSDNERAWKTLPDLEGVNIVTDAKPQATVLAMHPRLRTRSGKPMPVFVVGEYGRGRTMAVTTDSLWRWGFVAAATPGDDGRHYDKLWENSIRWLIQDPELQYLHVHTDAIDYAPGSTARIDLRLLQPDYTPLSGGTVTLEVIRNIEQAEETSVFQGTLEVDEHGNYSHELSGMAPGMYRVRAVSRVGEREVVAGDVFLVREASTELDIPAADQSLLRAIAAATAGTYVGNKIALPVDLPFTAPRIVRVDERADVELWSRSGLLLLAFLFLGLEWTLRQRSGYL